METTGPYLVIYTSLLCLSSKRFMQNYDDLVNKIRNLYPNINIIHISSKHFHGKFDENKYPSYILRYSNKFPNLILIPSPLWNIGMKNRECGSPVKITKGVSSFSSIRKSPSVNNILDWLQINHSQEFISLNSISSEEFLNTYYDEIYPEQRIENQHNHTVEETSVIHQNSNQVFDLEPSEQLELSQLGESTWTNWCTIM